MYFQNTLIMISRHQQLAIITKESSWNLNRWHPRDSHDPKNVPDLNNPLIADDTVAVAEGSQWFSALLPCEPSNVDQVIYAHFDNKPTGYWTMDIIGESEMMRTYPTVQTLLYLDRKIDIVPKFIVLHLYRDNHTEKLPDMCYVGWVDKEKFDDIISKENAEIPNNEGDDNK